MGLSVCRSLVTSMGGGIVLESAPGMGTLCRLWLPRAVEVPAPADVVAAPRSTARRRVLVIDDEPMVGGTIRRMLHRAHEVEVVPTALEALERVRAGARYDAVLCDLMMPGVSGVDLHEELERIAPDIARRTGFLTGGAFTPRASEFLARMRHRTIDKPFEVDHVLALVARLLDEGDSEP
jgi:CheY-like chemotaxis protein